MEDDKIDQWKCGNYSYESDLKMTRSGPDIRLTELEQQLEVAETRCGSLKSQLDYMKMLYQGVQPCSVESIQVAEELPENQSKNVAQSSPRDTKVERLADDVETCKENITTDVEDVKYYQFLKEIHKMQEISGEFDTDLGKTSPRQSSKSQSITPRFIERQSTVLREEHESISAECRRTKQIRKTHTVTAEIAPESVSILTSVNPAGTSFQIPEACKEYDNHAATVSQHPIRYSPRLQNDLTTARNLTSRFTSENKSEYGDNGLVGQKKEIRKQELILKLSESMDSAPITIKRKRINKVDKRQRTGLCTGSVVKKILNSKYEDSLSVTSNNKSKRKKGKLRSANSRNTVTTKEANLTDRKVSKKRKQKGYSSATHMSHQVQPPTQYVRTRAEVVEIYHNNAVEGGSGSISISSSKHSKHETANQLQNNKVLMKNDDPTQTCSTVTYQQQQHLPHHQPTRISDEEVLHEETYARETFDENNNEGFQKYSSRSQRTQNRAIQNSNREEAQCRSAPHPSQYYDPTVTRNYELPTVASKLKKVNRSYFNRFNFRNIPFVVSTSVTPSHNLGLNIQQVLSIMKTRQPMASGMAPLLIRKMSRGLKPVSTILDRINDSSYSQRLRESTILGRQNDLVSYERPKTTTECTALIDETIKSKYTGCLTAQTGILRFIPTTQTNSDEKTLPNHLLRDDKEDTPGEINWIQQQESGCICCSKKSKSYNKMLKQYTSRKSITGNPTLTASALLRERQEEINIGDNQYNQIENVSGNAKGIREVLINLHDQFEGLNIAYEKLQKEAENSNDKSIAKQAAALEKELTAKEDEINAVVGLYKEVLQLKRQVHSIHGKNSFVCIATSDNRSSPAMVPRSANMRAQLVINPMQILGMRNKNALANVREPATATRLAGLLREIQSFQKQLLAL